MHLIKPALLLVYLVVVNTVVYVVPRLALFGGLFVLSLQASLVINGYEVDSYGFTKWCAFGLYAVIVSVIYITKEK